MNVSLPDLIDRFAGLNALVIGEAILDTYLEGSAGRLAREAPVPVVTVARRLDLPGGAANTAVNLAALGANVSLVSATGDDPEAAALRRVLDEAGVATDALVQDRSRQTLAKHRVLAGTQMLVRYDQGSTGALDPEVEDALISRIATLYAGSDAVLISDYAYGILTPRVIEAIAALQAHAPRLLLADSRDLARYRQAGVTVAKPNSEECTRLLGRGWSL
jgi:D-beta-D-heptose 7-phosphate kinase/D-beta-D-heptose 1-phosphate adenosyltransferase